MTKNNGLPKLVNIMSISSCMGEYGKVVVIGLGSDSVVYKWDSIDEKWIVVRVNRDV